MNQVNSDYEQINKRVKALKFQLKDFDSRNNQLQNRLSGLRRLTPNKSNKSPIEILQENLHLDRRQIIEYFKPIKEQEFQYIRNQRIKTEQQLLQAKIDDIQQKQNKVKQIEKFQIDLPLKVAKFQAQKICQARQKQNQFLEENQLIINQKLQQIQRLKQEESYVIEQIYLQFILSMLERNKMNYKCPINQPNQQLIQMEYSFHLFKILDLLKVLRRNLEIGLQLDKECHLFRILVRFSRDYPITRTLAPKYLDRQTYIKPVKPVLQLIKLHLQFTL